MAVFAVPDHVNQDAAPSCLQAPAPPAILNRLRLETRGEHDAVERVLDLMGTSLTRDSYRQRLAQFYGFYGPLEAALHTRCAATSPLATLSPRLYKTALLRQDLFHLGVTTGGLPLCCELPPIQTPAEVLGCLYVMEGATLGGRLITQHIQATFGITPATGGSFFEGYGDNTGKMWQAMRQQLVSCAVDTQTENAIVANAIATFACLRGWCEARNAEANNDANKDVNGDAENYTKIYTYHHTEADQRA